MHLVHDPATPVAAATTFDEFLKTDIRAGTIRDALAFPGARNPAYVLMIDFGSALGVRKSVAQITERHALADLPGRRVMAVVNFPPRQIGPMRSEVLVLGFADSEGRIVLAGVGDDVPDGARLA